MLTRRTTERRLWRDLEGEIMGDVLLPAGFHPTEIGTDYVFGIVRDELDVPYVRMYALDRAVRGNRGPATDSER